MYSTSKYRVTRIRLPDGFVMEKGVKERAAFFTAAEQELVLEGYEEHKHIIQIKGNTIKIARMRKEAWQKIADKLNSASPIGPKRSWKQVKIKYKNILQTANKKRSAWRKSGEGVAVQPLPAEELGLRINVVECKPEVSKSEPLSECSTSNGSVTDLPVIMSTMSAPEEDDTFDTIDCKDTTCNQSPEDEESNTAFQERVGSASASDNAGKEEPEEDVRTLYKHYLKSEIKNREHEMRYRALKLLKVEQDIRHGALQILKVEKEIQLLDKKLEENQ